MAKKQWIDENGIEIPGSRVTAAEKLREAVCDRLLKRAQKVNGELKALKDEFSAGADDVLAALLAENGADLEKMKPRKGNLVIYSFDRAVRIEVDINERIEFDDAMILVAKGHMDEFLKGNTAGVDDMIREILQNAFSTSRGKLDTRKVLDLMKYRQRADRAKYPSFHQMLDAIEKSIRRPNSKRYFRISRKDEHGVYQAVDLNFSSIQL